MKAFKKVLSLALACVMALTLLTACGGGSGGSSKPVTLETSKTMALAQKIAAKEFSITASASYSAGSTTQRISGTIALKGNNAYIEYGTRNPYTIWVDANYAYLPATQMFSGELRGIDDIEDIDNILIEVPASSNDISAIISDDSLWTISTLQKYITSFSAGTTKVGGSNYYSESIDLEVQKIPVTATFCYAGDKPVYLIVNMEYSGIESEYTIKIDEFTTSVSSSIFDISSYKTMTAQEFRETYIYPSEN